MKYLTSTERDTLLNITNVYISVHTELDNLETDLANIKTRKNELLEKLKHGRSREEEFMTEIKDKYGDIKIDINSGAFKMMSIANG